jgi:hypothetical protein
VSSLIFHTDREQAFIATDTLVTSSDGKPAFFTTKAFVVPHLRMIMAGTGVVFLGKWFIHVNDEMLLKGVDNLDDHAPDSLARIWKTHKETRHAPVPDNVTTTVYHFGFSEEEDVIHSYAYRSVNNFRSEALPYNLYVKPECEIPQRYQLPMDIKAMMDSQRDIQATRPKSERVYIGGQIQIHHLMRERFEIRTLDRFEDFESTKREIGI